nr:mitochondrial amidoxime-reducing component 1-like [Leptinotarsa decemlineata]
MVQRVSSQSAIIIAAGVTAAFTILGTYFYQKRKRSKVPAEWTPVGKVKKMSIFPMKSGRRMEVQQAECTKRGLMECEKSDKTFRLRDRAFVVYQEKTMESKTGRNHNKMVLVEVKALDESSVVFEAPGIMSLTLQVPCRSKNSEVFVKFFQDEPVFMIDCGAEAAKWISNYLLQEDFGLRLGYNDGSHQRVLIPKFLKELDDYNHRGISRNSAGLNSDLTAVMMMTQASVDDVNRRMFSPHVPAESYRPNLLMDDPNLEPFEEDNWEWIKVGDVIMKNVSECGRCIMTTIDMETGMRRSDREPLKTMEKYRISKGPVKDPVMGIMLEVFRTGKISVGDTVYVGKTV